MNLENFSREQLYQLVKLERERQITFFLFGMCFAAIGHWIYKIIINL